jgi:hypothetical protein
MGFRGRFFGGLGRLAFTLALAVVVGSGGGRAATGITMVIHGDVIQVTQIYFTISRHSSVLQSRLMALLIAMVG